MKRIYDVLKDCRKEEEVKSEFCKFFKMKINALKAIDHYTENVLFEFKYDRNFKNAANVAAVATTVHDMSTLDAEGWGMLGQCLIAFAPEI